MISADLEWVEQRQRFWDGNVLRDGSRWTLPEGVWIRSRICQYTCWEEMCTEHDGKLHSIAILPQWGSDGIVHPWGYTQAYLDERAQTLLTVAQAASSGNKQ